jgi:methionine synthase I (cobalamin-dependent)
MDAATGTMLRERGLPADHPPDLWVIERPRAVLELHAAYVSAGADVILTDTFGANRARLASLGAAHLAETINRGAVGLAREAASRRGALVAGDIGPTGIPWSAEAWREQAALLCEAGVDLFVVETMLGLDEAMAALDAVRSAAGDVPVVVMLAFPFSKEEPRKPTDRDHRPRPLADGASAARAARSLEGAGAAAVGVNCSAIADCMAALRSFSRATSLPLAAKPSPRPGERRGAERCAVDLLKGMGWQPPGSGRAKVRGASGGARAPRGLRLLGGCCGTTPDTIRLIRKEIGLEGPGGAC